MLDKDFFGRQFSPSAIFNLAGVLNFCGDLSFLVIDVHVKKNFSIAITLILLSLCNINKSPM